MTNNFVGDRSDFDAFLLNRGLMQPGEAAHWQPLTGGVSSDIWRVDLPGRSLCVKRALPKLKVSADWEAPISRNAYEWAWLQFAAIHCPENVPRPLAHDPKAGLFAMSYLAIEHHPVWKEQLLAGHVDASTAAAVGRLMGCLHASSARSMTLAAQFDTDDSFYALRLEPYLVACAARYPELAEQLYGIVKRTAACKLALVHGDVSPKNILVGPKGPVLLDAECAWFGDPSFDLAFCLNHLLLKGLKRQGQTVGLRTSFHALAEAYFDQVDWEPRQALEARAASLLPALLLARVDGKSPVEYLTSEDQRKIVRDHAIPLLSKPVHQLLPIADTWYDRIVRCG